MIQKVFGVRDTKALAFLQPFFSASTGAAVRAFGDAVNEGNSPLSKHPEDYLLYEIGDFDDQTGELIACNPLKMLGCGKWRLLMVGAGTCNRGEWFTINTREETRIVCDPLRDDCK